MITTCPQPMITISVQICVQPHIDRSMMIAQNGPGITNFVTPVKTAFWNHTPLLLVTPQALWGILGDFTNFTNPMVVEIHGARRPTRPSARVDFKKWNRWPCSRIACATKRRRMGWQGFIWIHRPSGESSFFFPALNGQK